MGFQLIGLLILHSVTLAVTSLGDPLHSLPRLSSVQQFCNAISLGGDLRILPASCVSHLAGTLNLFTRVHCSIDKSIIHPEYVFLSNNIAVVRLQCPLNVLGPSISIRNVTEGNLLTLMAMDAQQQRQVTTPVQVASCSVCQHEYEVFDCDRQLCLRLVGKYRSQLRNLDGLSGGALYTNGGHLAGILSYGFTEAHLVAERLAFHAPFIRHSIEALGLGSEDFEINRLRSARGT
uniref:Putative secreted protein n=1 Tax=Anopheles darlingi TaxID=43151 RepID=A0A2M4D028_ANODA